MNGALVLSKSIISGSRRAPLFSFFTKFDNKMALRQPLLSNLDTTPWTCGRKRKASAPSGIVDMCGDDNAWGAGIIKIYNKRLSSAPLFSFFGKFYNKMALQRPLLSNLNTMPWTCARQRTGAEPRGFGGLFGDDSERGAGIVKIYNKRLSSAPLFSFFDKFYNKMALRQPLLSNLNTTPWTCGRKRKAAVPSGLGDMFGHDHNGWGTGIIKIYNNRLPCAPLFSVFPEFGKKLDSRQPQMSNLDAAP